MSPTIRSLSGRSAISSTRTSSSRMATRVSCAVAEIRISLFTCALGTAPHRLSFVGARRLRRLRSDAVSRPRPTGRGSPPGVAAQGSRNDDLLDFAGTLADLADLGVAQHTLERALRGVA